MYFDTCPPSNSIVTISNTVNIFVSTKSFLVSTYANILIKVSERTVPIVVIKIVTLYDVKSCAPKLKTYSQPESDHPVGKKLNPFSVRLSLELNEAISTNKTGKRQTNA